LNISTGKTFRLPSEAEWEYACRAGTITRFYWGADPGQAEIGDYAWYAGNCNCDGFVEGTSQIVGMKLPNAWGLYDMIGNVYEWCEDDWHDDYTGAVTDGSAWMDSPTGSHHVARSAPWYALGKDCRSAARSDTTATTNGPYWGFRVVMP